MSDTTISVCSELVPIDVTAPYLKIALLQFWRGEQEFLKPYPLHWALYVETGPDVGNTYEIVGDQDTYTFRVTENQPLEKKEDCRGGCYVGRLNSEAELALMGDILKKIEISRNIPAWNSHEWVKTALRTLKDLGFCIHTEKLTWYARLQRIMLCQLESWLGVEDGDENPVQFVGYEYLECVIHSRLRMLQRRSEVRGLWRMVD